MKTRIISAIIALAICLPILFLGGTIYKLGIYILSIISLHEFLELKQTKKEMPSFINFISYLILTLLVLSNINTTTILFKLDFRIISGLFLVFLLPTVLYQDNTKYSIADAFFFIGSLVFIGASFSLLILIRNISLNLIIYLFVITIFTDTYALLVGKLIGKHKMVEKISPNKTWEGMIGGTFFGVVAGVLFYNTVIDNSFNILTLIGITLFLSIIGQYGDLVFSTIKRYFGKKDFSNIMPGHGGILDRLDSIIFVVLSFTFFIGIL
ncbi:MAG: phosphatidate cytidylyltransferase [Bacilli bacterium]